MKNLRPPLLLAVITVGALAPFLHKAFDIDDPLFLWMAEQITKHPLNPYGFEVNWSSMAQPMWLPMQNPPLCSYYIAVVASVVGWSEVGLHAAFMLPAIVAVLGTFALARRLCAAPATAALLTLFTPVFLISASNVMCDVMLLALWVWSIEFWLAGLARGKHWCLGVSAALAVGATLTKYFGISLVPLLLIYSVVRERRLRPIFAYLCIPLIALLAYEWITKACYGRPLFTSAMLYLGEVAATVKMPVHRSFLTGCSFVGGCMISALLFVPLRRALVLGGIGLVFAMTALFSLVTSGAGSFGDNSAAVRFEGGFFAAVGVAILALAFYHFARRRDAEALMLLLWIGGTFGFASFLNWSITARTILPIVPAVAILLMRHWNGVASLLSSFPSTGWRLAAAAALSLVITYADYRQASTSRDAARHFRKRFHKTSANVWFQSHWGFQWYMQQWRSKPFVGGAVFRSGDVMIIPSNNADPNEIARESVIRVEEIALQTMPLVATFAPGTGAGFYSSARGPVPWVIGRIPSQRCEAVVFR